jgi:hypothetical protein
MFNILYIVLMLIVELFLGSTDSTSSGLFSSLLSGLLGS